MPSSRLFGKWAPRRVPCASVLWPKLPLLVNSSKRIATRLLEVVLSILAVDSILPEKQHHIFTQGRTILEAWSPKRVYCFTFFKDRLAIPVLCIN